MIVTPSPLVETELLRRGVRVGAVPADLRLMLFDLLAIQHDPALRALARSQAIDAAPDMMRALDAHTNLPKRDLAQSNHPPPPNADH